MPCSSQRSLTWASSNATPGLLGAARSRFRRLKAIYLARVASGLAILRNVNGPSEIRIALAQVNPTVGAVKENRLLVEHWITHAREAEADLVVFPELVLSGYPPDDLVFRLDFLDAVSAEMDELARGVSGIVALVGFPERSNGERSEPIDPLSSPLSPIAFNSVAVLQDGEIAAVYRKQVLPNYGVFDERRHFEPGTESLVFQLGGRSIGVTICEDIWITDGPAVSAVDAGADLVVNCSASPFARGKSTAREEIVAERASELATPVALCNMVGGQDELVFDGGSVISLPDGRVASARSFQEDLLCIDLDRGVDSPEADDSRLPDLDQVYAALRLGLHDYTKKNGFERVVLGLSGGIDSALVAMLACDALGPEAVVCVVMPSPHSSPDTQGDARDLAESLGSELVEIPIAPIMNSFAELLASSFDSTETGLAEENIQSRIRGTLIMALSNKFGWLPLATGNKSEMAVGYATLYGDMAGGFAPIKDVPKTLVYDLIRSRNGRGAAAALPQSILDRPPSAELRPDQLDTDSLPPYETLDAILALYVERDFGRDQIVAEGFEVEVVDEVIRLVDRAEYKRRQAPPGTRISSKAFGRDRRLPVTNRFSSLRPLPR
jgi:NAD+ synthase (glutamine-hydrolysing)